MGIPKYKIGHVKQRNKINLSRCSLDHSLNQGSGITFQSELPESHRKLYESVSELLSGKTITPVSLSSLETGEKNFRFLFLFSIGLFGLSSMTARRDLYQVDK